MERSYEIVLFGITGFTGELVARYLANQYAGKVSWAAAGRNEKKVREVLNRVGADVPVLIADAADPESLVHMVKQTKLVMALVGPYARHGVQLFKACAGNGTHYVDLTGEPAFHAKMVQQYGHTAATTKALMIPACGFDSVPSDLCAFLAVQRLKELGGSKGDIVVGEVKSVVTMNVTPSGGSWATFLLGIQSSDADKELTVDPYSASPTLRPFQWMLKTWGTQPGSGPSEEERKKGYLEIVTIAQSVDKRHRARVTMTGPGDVGYEGASKMAVESAMAIIKDFDRLPAFAKEGGMWTPATALGSVLKERLVNSGHFEFIVEDDKKA
ncbi:hypothetical protein MNV49_007419 [Pseudohyphozyma bogoriensis]|nr:hypothetical protein MNV49_007419 [Pseudohyphozyma bogoriensis]